MSKLIKLTIYIIALISLNSCILTGILIGSAVVAGGGAIYLNGYYEVDIPRNIETVYNAAIKTLQSNQEYKLFKHGCSKSGCSIDSETKSDNISISLSSNNKQSTRIKIHFGTLGNDQKSVDLTNQIVKNIT